MAGTIKANAVQLGDSATATNNFVLQTNTDGTAKLSRGNLGATTQDILSVDAASKVNLPMMPFVGTAPIVESGSSANGSWIKWADGTMICTGGYAGPITTSTYVTPLVFGNALLTFPITFYSAPLVLVGPAQDQASNGWCNVGATTTTTVSIGYYTKTTSVTSTNIGYLAIGRWKA